MKGKESAVLVTSQGAIACPPRRADHFGYNFASLHLPSHFYLTALFKDSS
ncbi:hypothetical protein IFU01_12640 [Oxalobacteraceae sp. CFBP 8763]|nr:hypothetical protein [Oxalobacteraceae sp. CFBP 8763]